MECNARAVLFLVHVNVDGAVGCVQITSNGSGRDCPRTESSVAFEGNNSKAQESCHLKHRQVPHPNFPSFCPVGPPDIALDPIFRPVLLQIRERRQLTTFHHQFSRKLW